MATADPIFDELQSLGGKVPVETTAKERIDADDTIIKELRNLGEKPESLKPAKKPTLWERFTHYIAGEEKPKPAAAPGAPAESRPKPKLVDVSQVPAAYREMAEEQNRQIQAGTWGKPAGKEMAPDIDTAMAAKTKEITDAQAKPAEGPLMRAFQTIKDVAPYVEQWAKDVYGVTEKVRGGIIKGMTLGIVDPETGQVGIPFTSKKAKVTTPMGKTLQEDYGVSKDIAENPYIGLSAEMTAVGGPWTAISSNITKGINALRMAHAARTGAVVSGSEAGATALRQLSTIEQIGVQTAAGGVVGAAFPREPGRTELTEEALEEQRNLEKKIQDVDKKLKGSKAEDLIKQRNELIAKHNEAGNQMKAQLDDLKDKIKAARTPEEKNALIRQHNALVNQLNTMTATSKGQVDQIDATIGERHIKELLAQRDDLVARYTKTEGKTVFKEGETLSEGALNTAAFGAIMTAAGHGVDALIKMTPYTRAGAYIKLKSDLSDMFYKGHDGAVTKGEADIMADYTINLGLKQAGIKKPSAKDLRKAAKGFKEHREGKGKAAEKPVEPSEAEPVKEEPSAKTEAKPGPVAKAGGAEKEPISEPIVSVKPEEPEGVVAGKGLPKREQPAETGFAPALRPSVMYQGKQFDGEVGGTHPELMKENEIPPDAAHERGFVDPDGNFLTREQAETWLKENDPETYKKWQEEAGKGAELHAQDLAAAKKEVIEDAVATGEIKPDDLEEHRGTDKLGEAAGASASDRVPEGGEVTEEKAKEGAAANVIRLLPHQVDKKITQLAKELGMPRHKIKKAHYDEMERGLHELEAEKKGGKEAWKMTPIEYGTALVGFPHEEWSSNMDLIEKIADEHESIVQKAIDEGKPVPPEVMKEYPDMVPQQEGKEGDTIWAATPRGRLRATGEVGPRLVTPAPKFDDKGYATEDEAVAAISNRKLELADYDIAPREGRYFVEPKAEAVRPTEPRGGERVSFLTNHIERQSAYRRAKGEPVDMIALMEEAKQKWADKLEAEGKELEPGEIPGNVAPDIEFFLYDARSRLQAGQAGGQIGIDQVTDEAIYAGSAYPPWFSAMVKDFGSKKTSPTGKVESISAKDTINIINKKLDGKALTGRQQAIYNEIVRRGEKEVAIGEYRGIIAQYEKEIGNGDPNEWTKAKLESEKVESGTIQESPEHLSGWLLDEAQAQGLDPASIDAAERELNDYFGSFIEPAEEKQATKATVTEETAALPGVDNTLSLVNPEAKFERLPEESQTKSGELFPLTSEWQEIPKDAVIEPGADVQMDMASGKVYAKRYPTDEGEKAPYKLEEATGDATPSISVRITDAKALADVTAIIGATLGRKIAPENLRLWKRNRMDDLGKLGSIFQKKIMVFQVEGEDLRALPGYFVSADATAIYLNATATDPHMVILGHELLHALRYDAPDIYDGFVSHVEATEHFKERRAEYEKTYGRELTDDETMEEYAADYIGRQFVEPEFWENLISKKPGIFRKVYDALIRLLAKLDGLVFQTRQFFKDFRKAERSAVKAMADYADRMRGDFKPPETEGEVKRTTPHVPELARDVFADETMKKEAEGLKWETPKGAANIYTMHKRTGKSYSQLIMEKAIEDKAKITTDAPAIFEKISKLAEIKPEIAEAIKTPEPAPAEPRAAEPRTTGIKNAVTLEERETKGLSEVEVEAKRSFGAAFNEGKRLVDSGERDPRIMAEELAKKPRALSAEESVMLIYDRMRLQNDHHALMDSIEDAMQKRDDIAETELRLKLAKVEDDINTNDEAARRTGYEQGLGLAARRMMIMDDYSLARNLQRARVANAGQPIAEETRAKIEELTKKLEEANQKIQKYDEEASQRAADEALRELKKESAVKKHLGQARERKIVAKKELDAEFGNLVKNLNEILSPTTLHFMFDPQAVVVLAQMARNRIMAGVASVEDMVGEIHDQLKDDFPDITKRDIRDAISGYGKTSMPSRDEIETQLREMRRQARLISAYEDAVAGQVPLRSGPQRDPLSDEVRRLGKEVKQAMRESGIDSVNARSPEEQWRTSLEAVKTRLRNQIADLTKQIETGEKSPKKIGIEYDEEANALKDQRDKLKDVLEQMEGKPEMSPEQKIKVATAAVQKSIAEYERRIKEKDLFPERKPSTTPETPELKDLREKRDKLKEIYKAMQDEAKPKRTPEEIALQSYKTRTKNRITELEERLKNKDFAKVPKKTLTLDPEAMKLKADSERLKNNINEEVWKLKLANQTGIEKAQRYIVKWRRFELLSSVTTVAKLTNAALSRFATSPTEDLAGGLWSAIPGYSQIMAESPRYGGGLNIQAEAKAFRQFVEKQTAEDMWETIKTGKGQLDVLYSPKQGNDLPPEALDFFGHLHGALKVLPKRAEFFRSLEKNSQWAANRGMDISDPVVQMTLCGRAYDDANRAILMNRNAITDWYQMSLRHMASKGTGGQVMTTAAKVLLPIVRVPTNFALETMDYTFGVPKGTAQVIKYLVDKDALKNITPEQADNIGRSLSKGLIGLALLAIGYYNHEDIGGYYQPGERRKAGDVKWGGIRIGGVELPHWFLHIPALEVLQLGSTIHRVQNSYAEKLKGGGLLAGAIAATKGVISNIPFLEEPSRLAKGLKDTESMAKAGAELATSMVVPPDVGKLARATDTDETGEEIKRKPATAADVAKLQIPGLREEVPRNVKLEKRLAREKAAEGNAGKMLFNAVQEHKITEIEKSAISAIAKGDMGEVGRLIKMVSNAKHMELKDLAVGIQEKATDEEKRILKPIFRAKLMKKAGDKEITQAEKQKYLKVLNE